MELEGSPDAPIVVDDDERPEVSSWLTMSAPVAINDLYAPETPPPDSKRLRKSNGRSLQIEQPGSAAAPIVIDDDGPEVCSGPMMESPVVINSLEAPKTTPPPPPLPPVPHAGSNMEALITINHHDEPKVDSGMPTRRTLNPVALGFSLTASDGPIGLEEENRGSAGVDSAAVKTELKCKMELKMSKKILVTKLPSNIRELLATGLLEGLQVKYITSMQKQIGLKGVIKGTGILCHCTSCIGSNAISAYQFEQHAGSLKKNPSYSIYLENGNTIRDVLEACKAAPLDMLEASIQNAISLVHPMKPPTCQKCNEPFHTSDTGDFALLCDSCLELNQPQTIPSSPDGSDSKARLSLVSDSSGSASKNISSHKNINFGKLTKKDLGLHKLVFMGDTLPEGTEVGYYVGGQRELQGYIKDSGILCLCCSTVVSPSQFEAHAGHAQRRKPYNNIYTSNGVSLHELSVSLSKGRKLSASENDDLCSICADGGDLLLCDLCPRAFHIDCVGLSSIPKGDWYCRYCQNMHQRDKCVEHNDNAIAAGRIAGVDPIEQIFKRCIRIVETPEANVGGCVFCRRHDFSKGFGPRTVLFCDQCEKEYHVGCLKDNNMGNLKEIPKEEWFCCTDCSRIYAALQELVICGEVRLQDLDSDIIKVKLGEKGLDKLANVDVRWRLLSGKTSDRDSKPLLSSAVSIFLESFDPIVESVTGRDLIPCMAFGRSTRDQDFGGMYCAILTVDSSVVSTGILRILGREVAELPLVATSTQKQGQGYFQLLFSCIERLLSSLNVKHFVLPAAEEAESIWTKKFGFKRVTPDQLHEYTRGAHTMIFQGTSMLHKHVPNSLAPTEECQGS